MEIILCLIYCFAVTYGLYKLYICYHCSEEDGDIEFQSISEQIEHLNELSICFVRSTNLGCPAIGLLGRVMDLPPEWNFTKAGLIAVCPDGETAVESALADLEEWGYLQKIVQMPNESPTGRIRTVYNFYEYSEKDHSIPRYDYELETYTVDNATLNRVKKVGNYSMISSKLLRNKEIRNKLLGFLLKVLSLPNYWNFSMSAVISPAAFHPATQSPASASSVM